jgi:biotin carboxylase
MKKILIIGAGTEQVEAIKAAKAMGHYVISTDMNLQAPGIRYADKAYEISTTDARGNIEIARKESIDGVMTVCSETAVPTVAKVAEELGLPSFSRDTALKATDKEAMRKSLEGFNIRVSPNVITDKLHRAEEFIQTQEGPWILKPTDNSGQRGTSIIRDKHKLAPAFELAVKSSRAKKVLIDRFIQGPEIHVTILVIEKKVRFLALSDRITLDDSNFGIAVRHLGPSETDPSMESEIKQMCEDSVKAIGLENGVATCEIIIEHNIPYLMEIAVRVPGGYLREVAAHLSGIDIIKTTIWNALGEQRSYSDCITEPVYPAVSVKFISALNLQAGLKKIERIDNLKEIQNRKGITLCRFHFDKVFTVPDLISSVGRFGVIIAVGETRKEAADHTEKAFQALRIDGTALREYTNYNKNNRYYNS